MFQVVINLVAAVASPPKVQKVMPEVMKAHVELMCSPPLSGFLTSLCYNMLLIVVCTYYAFRTRALPDNFNESRYITLCVYTTLVIWFAFLPTYFTTTNTSYRAVVISGALTLNATVTLLSLFTTKLYALYTASSAPAQPNTFKYNFQVKVHNANHVLSLQPQQNNAHLSANSSSNALEDQNTELTDFVNK